jgi:uncharacterized protein YbcI
MSEGSGTTRGASQRSQLADAVSSCVRDYTGRGPVSTRVLLNDETVVVVMKDNLTKGERILVEHGHDEEVLAIRGTYQEVMRREVSAAITAITGQPVTTFMSANSTDPDYAVEIFILGKPGDDDGDRHDGVQAQSRAGAGGAAIGDPRDSAERGTTAT